MATHTAPPPDAQKLKGLLSIVQVAQRVVPGLRETSRGAEYRAPACPCCATGDHKKAGKTDGAFTVDVRKNRCGCYRCGWTGDVITLWYASQQHTASIPRHEFNETVLALATAFGVDLARVASDARPSGTTRPRTEVPVSQRLAAALHSAAREMLMEHPAGERIRRWATEGGLSLGSVPGLGLWPDAAMLTTHGLSPAVLETHRGLLPAVTPPSGALCALTTHHGRPVGLAAATEQGVDGWVRWEPAWADLGLADDAPHAPDLLAGGPRARGPEPARGLVVATSPRDLLVLLRAHAQLTIDAPAAAETLSIVGLLPGPDGRADTRLPASLRSPILALPHGLDTVGLLVRLKPLLTVLPGLRVLTLPRETGDHPARLREAVATAPDAWDVLLATARAEPEANKRRSVSALHRIAALITDPLGRHFADVALAPLGPQMGRAQGVPTPLPVAPVAAASAAAR